MSQDTMKNHRKPHQDKQEAPLKESCAVQAKEGLSALLAGHQDTNVGDLERVLSVMGGGVLTAFGAVRGGLTGLGLAVLGGSLLYRGVTGHCEAYHSLGINTSDDAEPSRASDLGHAHS